MKYSSATKVPEMIISAVFLITGIWLYIIIGGIKTMHFIKLLFVVISIPLAVVGFKKMKKGFALISLLLIIGAYGIAEMSKTKPFIPVKNEMAISNDALSVGKSVFTSNCVFCHGADGKKMYRNAADLSVSGLDEAAIQQIVREGSKGKMPAYKIVISDENIVAVSKYVEMLR